MADRTTGRIARSKSAAIAMTTIDAEVTGRARSSASNNPNARTLVTAGSDSMHEGPRLGVAGRRRTPSRCVTSAPGDSCPDRGNRPSRSFGSCCPLETTKQRSKFATRVDEVIDERESSRSTARGRRTPRCSLSSGHWAVKDVPIVRLSSSSDIKERSTPEWFKRCWRTARHPPRWARVVGAAEVV